jgi:hypothetical protein
MIIGVIGNGFKNEFRASDLVLIPIMLIPPALIWWGFWILPGLRQGFHHKLRRQLLAFHLVVMAFCSMWLFSTVSTSGGKSAIFPTEFQIAGLAILILPVLITLFTSPEAKRSWHPNAGGNLRLHRRSDRFVAWLASRMR